MRRTLWLLIFLVPVAAAQAPVEGALEVSVQLGAPDLVLHEEEGATAGCTSRGVISPTPVTAGFRFRENATTEGCAEAVFDVPVPEGATVAEIRFTADRYVGTGLGDVPPQMRQELRVHGPDLATWAVFPPFSGNSPPTDVGFRTQAPPGTLRLGWLFSDEGTTGQEPIRTPARMNTFEASVSDHHVVFTGIPVTADTLATETERIDTITSRQYQATRFVVPSFGEAASVRLALTGERPTSIVGPEGPVAVDALRQTPSGWLLDAVPGEYVVMTEAVVQAHPVLFDALPYLVLGACMASTGGAWWAERRWSAHAHDDQAAALRTTRGWLFGLAAVLLVIFVWVLVAGAPLLQRIPLATAAWWVYLLIALLTFAMGTTTIYAMTQRRRALELHHRDQLAANNRILRRSNRDLEDFAAIASHDLQAPLRRVVGCTQMLDRRLREDLDDSEREMMDVVVANGIHMQHLVTDLLSLSRINEDSMVRKRVELGPMLRDVLVDLRPDIEAAGVEVSLDAEGTVVGTPSMLRQLFHNLISNAVKYRSEEPRVGVQAHPEGDEMVIEVRDNGPGIALQDQGRVFHIFQRVGRQDVQGSGIGLAVAQRIVEVHGGAIGLSSAPGEGSTFTVRLPGVVPPTPTNGR